MNIKKYFSLANIIIFIIGVFLILLILYSKYRRNYLFKNYGKYTVGEISEKYVGGMGSHGIDYRYKIDGKIHEGGQDINPRMVISQDKYLVVYYEYPNGTIINQMLFYKLDSSYKLGDDLTNVVDKSKIEFSVWD